MEKGEEELGLEDFAEAIGALKAEAERRVEKAGLEMLAELDFKSALASLETARLWAERARARQMRALAVSPMRHLI